MLVPNSDPTKSKPKKTHLWAKSSLQATVLLTVDENCKSLAIEVSLATCIWKASTMALKMKARHSVESFSMY